MRLSILALALLQACVAQDSRGLTVGEARTRKALVIGNQNYHERPLSNTLNDATDMTAALRKLGFSVDLAKDATKSEIEAQARRFVQSLRAGDIAWFYYAGHGFQIDGENYLVPV